MVRLMLILTYFIAALKENRNSFIVVTALKKIYWHLRIECLVHQCNKLRKSIVSICLRRKTKYFSHTLVNGMVHYGRPTIQLPKFSSHMHISIQQVVNWPFHIFKSTHYQLFSFSKKIATFIFHVSESFKLFF